LIILTTVTLAISNNALPDDDDDSTETCRSCFNANFNVNFKIVFEAIHLCVSWWIKKLDNMKMHGMYVVKNDFVIILCFDDRASLYNLVKRTNLLHSFS
jgi:hypothetical protein